VEWHRFVTFLRARYVCNKEAKLGLGVFFLIYVPDNFGVGAQKFRVGTIDFI
jgi:hypothetical protein